jgi:hypothetical protein
MPVQKIEVAVEQHGLRLDAREILAEFNGKADAGSGLDHRVKRVCARVAQAQSMQGNQIMRALN